MVRAAKMVFMSEELPVSEFADQPRSPGSKVDQTIRITGYTAAAIKVEITSTINGDTTLDGDSFEGGMAYFDALKSIKDFASTAMLILLGVASIDAEGHLVSDFLSEDGEEGDGTEQTGETGE